MANILDDKALDILFRLARTHKAWRDEAVSDVLLEAIYDLARMGPTSLNCCPMRVVFVKSEAAKARLAPALSKGNLDKTMAAPVTAIIAQDMAFYETLPRLAPQGDFRRMFEGKPQMIESTAFRNSSLQGAYFMLAARALGLDCGPMSGFDGDGSDADAASESGGVAAQDGAPTQAADPGAPGSPATAPGTTSGGHRN